MRFGLKFTDYCIVELIDLETAEVVAEGPFSVKRWLTAYDGNYTLKIIEQKGNRKMRVRTAKQWIKEVLNIEMPNGDIGGEWFAENDLPMIVKCTCCEMSMALPSALVNDAGETFCQNCVG